MGQTGSSSGHSSGHWAVKTWGTRHCHAVWWLWLWTLLLIFCSSLCFLSCAFLPYAHLHPSLLLCLRCYAPLLPAPYALAGTFTIVDVACSLALARRATPSRDAYFNRLFPLPPHALLPARLNTFCGQHTFTTFYLKAISCYDGARQRRRAARCTFYHQRHNSLPYALTAAAGVRRRTPDCPTALSG